MKEPLQYIMRWLVQEASEVDSGQTYLITIPETVCKRTLSDGSLSLDSFYDRVELDFDLSLSLILG